jgi:DNA polymerase III gamma/tau subunit
MLTDSAFNALLKTLEEPPSHTVFILATTEANKLPPTILSRCMRFDFRLISAEALAAHLEKIFKALKKDYEKEAVKEIATAAAGSVRDALSLADLVINYSEGKLFLADVLNILGGIERKKLNSLAEAIVAGDIKEALFIVDGLVKNSKAVDMIAKDLIKHFINLFIVCSGGADSLDLTKEHLKELAEQSKRADINLIIRAIDIFSRIESEIRYSAQPKIVLDAAVIKAANPALTNDYESLLARISVLEKKSENASSAFLGVNSKNSQSIQPKADSEAVEKKRAVNKARGRPGQEPEQDFYLDGSGSVYEQEGGAFIMNAGGNRKEEKREEEHFEKTKEQKSKALSARQIWGKVITGLREGGEVILCANCSVINNAEIKRDEFIVYTAQKNEYEKLNEKLNFNKISDIIASYGYKYRVVLAEAKKDAEEELSALFGNSLTKK